MNGEQHETGGSAANMRGLLSEMSLKHGCRQAVRFEGAVQGREGEHTKTDK